MSGKPYRRLSRDKGGLFGYGGGKAAGRTTTHEEEEDEGATLNKKRWGEAGQRGWEDRLTDRSDESERNFTFSPSLCPADDPCVCVCLSFSDLDLDLGLGAWDARIRTVQGRLGLLRVWENVRAVDLPVFTWAGAGLALTSLVPSYPPPRPLATTHVEPALFFFSFFHFS